MAQGFILKAYESWSLLPYYSWFIGQPLNTFICLYFGLSIVTRKTTPFNKKNIKQIEHATMCLNLLSSAADVVDFLEYATVSEILHQININRIFGQYDFF
jgi:hypothetical protein